MCVLNKRAFVLAFLGGTSAGLYSGFSGILDVVLGELGFSQSDAAALGMVAVCGGIVAGLVVGRIADYWQKSLKILLVVLYILAAICFAWFTLVASHIWLPFNFWMALISFSLAAVFLIATGPLFYEIIVEATYPVPEGTSAGIYALWSNVGGVIFIFLGDYMSALFMNSLMAVSTLVFALLIAMIRDEYKRTNIDNGESPTEAKISLNSDSAI
jgi:FLVCR family feline leukemia virus subgroup C receptor-related protein